MIESPDDLRELYPAPNPRSVCKQLDHPDRHCLRFVALAPFLVLASSDESGRLDASPRGGAPGFVKAPDARTLLLPDAPGNNRIDSLTNISRTHRVGMLFLVPGIDETLRVNGRAELGRDPAWLAPFADLERPPRLVMRVSVEEAYLHCAKAFMRSRLWHLETHVPRSTLPSLGEMLNEQIGSADPPESQAAMLERYRKDL